MTHVIKLNTKTKNIVANLKWNRAITAAYILHVVVVVMAAYLSKMYLPQSTPEGGVWNATNIPIIDHFARWDSGFFWNIARYGYNDLHNAPFFPLYPYSIRYLGKFFMLSGTNPNLCYIVSGLIISHVAFIGALYFLFRIVQEKFSTVIAKRTILIVALFPTSLFFTAVYTESLFMFTLLAAFFFGYRKKWIYVGICCALCLLTRNIGAISVLSMIILYIKLERPTIGLNKKTWIHFAYICLIPLFALLGFSLLLYVKLNDPLAFLHAEYLWGRKSALPWRAIYESFKASKYDFIFAVSFVVILIASFKKLPLEQWIYYFFALLIPLSSVVTNGTLESTPRYMIILFPAFTYLAIIMRDRLIFSVFLMINIICLFILQMMFGNWYWVA